jgi:hypothetical protein
MCQGDVMNAIQEHVDTYQLAINNASQVNAYQLVSNQWCLNKSWASGLSGKERSITSQDGQDGILDYLFSEEAVGATNKYYVEIGFNSPHFEGGSGANTYNLHKNGYYYNFLKYTMFTFC